MDITRRRILLGGAQPTEGEMGFVTLTETKLQILLPNNFGTTNLMVFLRQTEGINEDVWATHAMLYSPYDGNYRIGAVDRPFINSAAESRTGWNYSYVFPVDGNTNITNENVIINSSSNFPFLAGTYQYVIVKLG